MAVQTGSKSGGPFSGQNKTPAPDSVTNIRAPNDVGGFGENGFTGASSVAPGKRTISALAKNLESSVDDPVMASVLASGTGRRDENQNIQTRNVAQGAGVPTAVGHHNPNLSNPKVPSGPADAGDPQGLKRAMGFGK